MTADPRTNPNVDFYFDKAGKWQDAFRLLRTIVLDTGLTEALKWGVPCYTFGGKNVVLIHGFKDYCALLFHKGSLLKDPQHLLIQQTENVQGGRQIRFTDTDTIRTLAPVLAAYIYEAAAIEEAGLKVPLKKTDDFEMVAEFRERLEADPALKTAFGALTPGRQRAYLLHFAAAKQAKTREARIEKCKPAILAGKGLND